MADTEASEFVIASINVTRTMDAETGEVTDALTATDGDGDQLDLITALGMMRLAEWTLMHPEYADEDG